MASPLNKSLHVGRESSHGTIEFVLYAAVFHYPARMRSRGKVIGRVCCRCHKNRQFMFKLNEGRVVQEKTAAGN